jgi:O-antigen/teichoic acid export membrane protein
MTDPHAALLRQTAAGTAWIVGWRVASRLLGLASTLVLVRLLVPADFGLVALAVSFAQAIEGFAWLDVEDAVVREKAPGRSVYDTGFTLNVLRGLLTAGAIALLAWPAGHAFAEPRLVPIVLALAAVTAVDGFLNIGIVDFRRDFAFDREFRLWILPRLAGVAVTVGVAAASGSYWALVAGIVTQRCLKVVASYRMHPYRPRFSLSAWGVLGRYSLWTWVLGLLTLLRDRADTLVLGRMLGTGPVGVFALAAEIAALPTTELVEPMCRAAFSGFARGRNEALTPAETWRRMIETTAVATLPAGVGISLLAAAVVRLAFGPAWLAAVLPMQALALAGTVTVFGYVSATLFRTHGLMRPTAGILGAAFVLRVGLLLALTASHGLAGAAMGVAAAIVLEQGSYVAQACRRFGIPPRLLAGAVWRSLFATAAMAAVLVGTGLGWRDTGAPWAQLLGGVALGAGVYGAVLLGLWVACGRPDGGERQLLALAGSALRRVLKRA